MAVIKLVDGTTWTAVGSLEGFGGEVSLSNYDFDIDKDGILMSFILITVLPQLQVLRL